MSDYAVINIVRNTLYSTINAEVVRICQHFVANLRIAIYSELKMEKSESI